MCGDPEACRSREERHRLEQERDAALVRAEKAEAALGLARRALLEVAAALPRDHGFGAEITRLEGAAQKETNER